MMQRQRVMLPQVLLVDDLEAGVVQRRLDEPGRGEVAVGEDVSVEELVRSGPVVRLVLEIVIWWLSRRPAGLSSLNISSK